MPRKQSLWISPSSWWGQTEPPLVSADPTRFFVPAYQGPFGWIGVRLDRKLAWSEVEELVVDAYRAAAPKKLLAELDVRG